MRIGLPPYMQLVPTNFFVTIAFAAITHPSGIAAPFRINALQPIQTWLPMRTSRGLVYLAVVMIHYLMEIAIHDQYVPG